MSKNLTVGIAGKDDVSAFIYLMNKQYSIKKNSDYFNWMFVNSYLPTKLFAVYDKNNPVAFYGSQIHRLSNGKNCSQSVDIITDEKYRGKGLFKLLEQEVFKYSVSNNCSAMSVLPNQSGMKAHERLNTWITLAKIDNLIFDCRKALLSGIKLNNQNRETSALLFLRDENFINWRYDKNPVYKYNKIFITDKEYAVVKIFHDKEKNIFFGDVVDLICDLNDSELIFELFRKASEFLISKGANYISTWALNHTLLYRVLIAMGFTAFSQERYFCIRKLCNNNNEICKIENWHLVQSNAEIY